MTAQRDPTRPLEGPADVSQVVWDLPCAGCGLKPPAPGCDGLCDDCWIEVEVLEDAFLRQQLDEDLAA